MHQHIIWAQTSEALTLQNLKIKTSGNLPDININIPQCRLQQVSSFQTFYNNNNNLPE